MSGPDISAEPRWHCAKAEHNRRFITICPQCNEQRIADLERQLAEAKQQSEDARNLGQRHVDQLDALRGKVLNITEQIPMEPYLMRIILELHQAADGGKGEG